LDANILPQNTKDQYIKKYQTLLNQLCNISELDDYNASDPHNHAVIVKEHVQMCMNVLSTATPDHAPQLYKELVVHCQRWDQIYGYDARKLYPELSMIWDQYGY
jgi:hypothetical protein